LTTCIDDKGDVYHDFPVGVPISRCYQYHYGVYGSFFVNYATFAKSRQMIKSRYHHARRRIRCGQMNEWFGKN
jgi:hypothetical protein